MLFEHHKKPLLAKGRYFNRVAVFAFYSFALIIFSLVIGTAGYHSLAMLSWEDSFLNASMILTGMGPVSEMPDTMAKVFSALYAIYSGVAFLGIAGIMFAPVVHRFLHVLHIEEGLNK